jgi:hypothetical protein
MKYVLMFTNDADLEQTVDPARAEEVYKKIFQWFEQGFGEGWIVNGGAELQPPSTATTVRHGDDGPVVTDGPYVELKEVVGGFSVIEAADLDAALAIARTWPHLELPGTGVEVRPVVDHENM